MNLSKKIKSFIPHQFIAVILSKDDCHIKIDVVKRGKVIKEDETTFILGEKDSLTSDAQEYFSNAVKKYKHTYISVFLNSLGQGAFSGCENERFSTFNVDVNNVEKLCVDNNWTVYASKIDINWIKKLFYKSGVDFIYSPFVILYRFIEEDRKKRETTLYILNEGKILVIIIMKENKFLYGSFLNLDIEKDPLIDEIDSIDDESGDSIMLDDLEADNMFDDIEKLDEISDFEDIDNITMPDKADIDAMMKDGELNSEKFLDINNHSKQIINYLKSSLKEFYESSLYESSFVQSVEIFEYASINYEVVDYLEKELLLDVEVKKVDILKMINELSKEEILH